MCVGQRQTTLIKVRKQCSVYSERSHFVVDQMMCNESNDDVPCFIIQSFKRDLDVSCVTLIAVFGPNAF